MSGVKIIIALLLADAPLIAAVPAARIKPGIAPQGAVLPYIAITEVSAIDRNIIKTGAFVHVVSRVQVTIMAATYPTQKSILALVRKACRDKTGTIASIANVTVQTDSAGPDFNDSELGFYMQSQDFRVSFSEAT